ncbi:MAG: Rdx family protein [Desulfobacula sp.]|nr:Rdx family protein [Desulfobacula sp.]
MGISPELIPGSNGVYEVIVDGKIVFSKYQTKRFPDNDEIIALIQNDS